jgi:hypothetical protein
MVVRLLDNFSALVIFSRLDILRYKLLRLGWVDQVDEGRVYGGAWLKVIPANRVSTADDMLIPLDYSLGLGDNSIGDFYIKGLMLIVRLRLWNAQRVLAMMALGLLVYILDISVWLECVLRFRIYIAIS